MMRERMVLICVLVAVLILPASSTTAIPPGLTFVEHVRNIGMASPTGLALDPSGRHLYVTGYPGSLVAFGHDPDTGALTFIEVEQDGAGGVEQMLSPRAVVVGPGGFEVYVAAHSSHSIVVFARNTVNGQIAYTTRYTNGEGGIHDMEGPEDLLIAPGGEHLYIAAWDSNAVSYFFRDTGTGILTQSQVIVDGAGGGLIDGIGGAAALALDSSGEYLYVLGRDDHAIARFRRNGDGHLSYGGMVKNGLEGVLGLDHAYDLIVSPDGRHVYAAGGVGDNLVIFDRDLDDGQLHYAGQVTSDDAGFGDLVAPLDLAFSQDGRDLYVGGGGGILQLGRAPSTGQLTHIQTLYPRPEGTTAMAGTAVLLLSHDEQTLYAASPNAGGLVTCSRNTESGRLVPKSVERSTLGLAGPVGMAVDPDGEFVFVTNNDDDTLSYFRRDPLSGTLRMFRRWSDHANDGLEAARAVVITSDGQNAYVAGAGSDAVAIFGLDEETGWFYQGRMRDGEDDVEFMQNPQSLALSPDNRYLYVASYLDHAVVVFRRGSEDGSLSYLGNVKQGDGGADGLINAYHIALDAEGNDLYVAGFGSDAIAHFERHRVSGNLNYQGRVKDGEGAEGLAGVSSVVVSPDGAYVYAAGRHDNALAIFARDDEDGDLEFYGYAPDGVGANTGLLGARAVTVSPDGRFVYVASQVSHAVAVFVWDDETGLIRFFEAHVDGEKGVDGLRTANGLALSPDGRHLYVSGYDDDGVALFRTRAHTHLPVIVR